MKMLAGIRFGLLMAGIAVMAGQPAYAANPSFADLLARAKAQAASGHKWAPAGNNMTETIMAMMDLIPTATPSQLTELLALLQTDNPPLPETAQTPPPKVAQDPPPKVAQSNPPATAPNARSVTTQPLPLRENPPPAADQQATLETPPRVPPIRPSPPALVKPPSDNAPGAVVPQAERAGLGTRSALLFARGIEAEHRGDLSGARRYYSSAARQGDAAAARNLGRLYDPAYLRQTALAGIQPDPVLAREWYKRAVTLGDAEARPLLEALSAR
jgi:TPR repeat protein